MQNMEDKEFAAVLTLILVLIFGGLYLWGLSEVYAECREVFSVFYCLMQ